MESNQNKESASKPNLISHILNLGHEAFRKGSLEALYIHILNNSRIVSAYDMSCIIDFRHGMHPKVVGIMGLDAVNRNTEYCIAIEALMAPFANVDKPIEINKEAFTENTNSKAFEVYNKIIADTPNRRFFLIPLAPPHPVQPGTKGLAWIVEYYDDKAVEGAGWLSLLAKHYCEAVWYFINSGRKAAADYVVKKNFFKTKLFWYFVIIFLILFLWIFRIDQNVSAECELIPKDKEIEYAPYAGIIKNVNFENGQTVKKGDIVLEYDTEDLLYDIEKCENKYKETTAKLDLTRQRAFNDVQEIGKIKLLTIEQSIDQIELEKYKWQLDNSLIKAEIPGVVISADKNELKGKAVTAGEKLFEVVKPGEVQVEVLVNEADSSVISNLKSITIYLHSMPEVPIKCKVVSVSPVPILVENRQFCYVVRANLDKEYSGLIYGMRGVARVSGEKVLLGYYLFRNIILWWRKI